VFDPQKRHRLLSFAFMLRCVLLWVHTSAHHLTLLFIVVDS
jgi:hypothetical protein